MKFVMLENPGRVLKNTLGPGSITMWEIKDNDFAFHPKSFLAIYIFKDSNWEANVQNCQL